MSWIPAGRDGASVWAASRDIQWDRHDWSRALLLGALAAVLALAAVPLVERPDVGLLALAAVVGVALAWISPAIPVGLAGMAAWSESITGLSFPDNFLASLVFVWVAAAVGAALLRSGDRRELLGSAFAPVWVTLLLGVLMLARLQGSADPGYGQHKLTLFLTLNLAFLVGGIVVAQSARDLDILLGLLVLVAAVAAVTLLVQFQSGLEPVFTGRFSLAGTDDPIELGRQSSIGILIAVYALVLRGGSALKVVALAAIPLLLVALMFSGSRGPFLGLLAGLGVLLVALPVAGRRGRLFSGVVGALVLAWVITTLAVPGQSVERVASLFTGEHDGRSSTGRIDLWAQAWEAFGAHPLVGIGTGGFADVAQDVRYPHNIFLEVGVELGVAGIVLLVVLSTLAIVGLVRASRERITPVGIAAVVGALLAAVLTNAFFSGDLATNAPVWLFVGVAAGLGARAAATARPSPEPRPDG